MSWIFSLDPVLQALFATLFTWGVTAIGAASVFFFKKINKNALNGMLGFAAGVMIAASFSSLIQPGIEIAESLGQNIVLVIGAGFLSGGAFLFVANKLLPHLHMGEKTENAEGIRTSWQRSVLLVMAITLHNIPEGLAVGVAFGATVAGMPGATLAGAWALALGIGLQNCPEGAAVSIPLRREGFSRRKAFFYGQASGIVEPIAGVLGAFAVVKMQPILPFVLSFAAGAMIFVVIEELIPEAHLGDRNSRSDIATIGAMIGFAVMLMLDIGLG